MVTACVIFQFQVDRRNGPAESNQRRGPLIGAHWEKSDKWRAKKKVETVISSARTSRCRKKK